MKFRLRKKDVPLDEESSKNSHDPVPVPPKDPNLKIDKVEKEFRVESGQHARILLLEPHNLVSVSDNACVTIKRLMPRSVVILNGSDSRLIIESMDNVHDHEYQKDFFELYHKDYHHPLILLPSRSMEFYVEFKRDVDIKKVTICHLPQDFSRSLLHLAWSENDISGILSYGSIRVLHNPILMSESESEKASALVETPLTSEEAKIIELVRKKGITLTEIEENADKREQRNAESDREREIQTKWQRLTDSTNLVEITPVDIRNQIGEIVDAIVSQDAHYIVRKKGKTLGLLKGYDGTSLNREAVFSTQDIKSNRSILSKGLRLWISRRKKVVAVFEPAPENNIEDVN